MTKAARNAIVLHGHGIIRQPSCCRLVEQRMGKARQLSCCRVLEHRMESRLQDIELHVNATIRQPSCCWVLDHNTSPAHVSSVLRSLLGRACHCAHTTITTKRKQQQHNVFDVLFVGVKMATLQQKAAGSGHIQLEQDRVLRPVS